MFIGTRVWNINNIVVEEFTERYKIGGIEKGTKAAADSVDVDPFISLFVEELAVS